ncbi:MAG: hypothetical protein D6785_03870 [Planctomycetota bacterium]|nr:MAG: hypothetical protein D6785_03870 [Planctomycetota bacterium]
MKGSWMAVKNAVMASAIVIFFMGTPILCLLIPLAVSVYVMQGYLLASLILYFLFYFKEKSYNHEKHDQE